MITTGETHTFAEDAKHLKGSLLAAPQLYGEAPVIQTKLLGDEKVKHDLVLHWSYMTFALLYVGFAGCLKVGQIHAVQAEKDWKERDDALRFAVGIVVTGFGGEEPALQCRHK